LRLYPKDERAYFHRGTAYAKKGDYGRAIKNYTKALSLDPIWPETYRNRGEAYRIKGDNDRAAADFSQALLIECAYKTA
jgi:tetratricopeptide (TPR) repeat protein